MKMRWLALALAILATAAASAEAALEVRQQRWGFDGCVVPGRFNLLSLLVVNNSPTAQDAVLRLKRVMWSGADTEIRLPCFVAPFASRWVQFGVYVEGDAETWVVSWGSGEKETLELASPRSAAPAVVLLERGDAALGGATAMRRFPENLFPASVALTDGLCAAVLDHVPRWEPARREAFMEWLRRGGVVHVVRDADGAYPRFVDELAPLNTVVDRATIGGGLVVRHPVARDGVSVEYLAAQGFPGARLAQPEAVYYSDPAAAFLPRLRKMIRTDHNWGLLFLLSLIYLGLIGPANYLGARKRRYCFVAMTIFFVTVSAASVTFGVVGRRGAGEMTQVHSISYARPVGNGEYDVVQWSNLFVTSSREYVVSYGGSYDLFHVQDDREQRHARIQGGREGALAVRVPLYSSCGYVHRGRLRGPADDVAVGGWGAGADLADLSLRVPAELLNDETRAWALYRDRVYPLSRDAGRLVLSPAGGSDANAFFSAAASSQYHGDWGAGVEDVQAAMRDVAVPVMGWATGRGAFMHSVQPAAVAGRLDVFIFTSSPASFSAHGDRIERETGCTLFHYILWRPN